MPRKVIRRRWRGDVVSGLDPAIAEYLLTGAWREALDDLKARKRPVLVMFLDDELAKLWDRHRVELEAEAARRAIKQPWWLKRAAERQRRGLARGNGTESA